MSRGSGADEPGAIGTGPGRADGSSRPSAGHWVQVGQGLIARELVDEFGYSERQAAEVLGLVPSAVSQYLTGKRLGATLARYAGTERVRKIVRSSAQRLVDSREGAGATEVLLDTALAISGVRGATPFLGEATEPGRRSTDRSIQRWTRDRIAGEQAAVTECMRLAQRSRDELTRAVFRQIASDSLRHAEIVAALASQLGRGIYRTQPSGITRSDIQRLIDREHAAERTSAMGPAERLGGVMRILWESMESDERKHDRLLDLLLRTEFPSEPRAPVRRPGRRPRSRRSQPPPPGRSPDGNRPGNRQEG